MLEVKVKKLREDVIIPSQTKTSEKLDDESQKSLKPTGTAPVEDVRTWEA